MPPWTVNFLGMRKGRKYSSTTCSSVVRSHGIFKIIIAKVVRMFLLLNHSGRRAHRRSRERIMHLHFNHLCQAWSTRFVMLVFSIQGSVVFVLELVPLGCHNWWSTTTTSASMWHGIRVKFMRKLIGDLMSWIRLRFQARRMGRSLS